MFFPSGWTHSHNAGKTVPWRTSDSSVLEQSDKGPCLRSPWSVAPGGAAGGRTAGGGGGQVPTAWTWALCCPGRDQGACPLWGMGRLEGQRQGSPKAWSPGKDGIYCSRLDLWYQMKWRQKVPSGTPPLKRDTCNSEAQHLLKRHLESGQAGIGIRPPGSAAVLLLPG